MLFVKNFKVVLLFLSITCCFNANAAFTAQPDSIKTGNFLLLTPIKESLADQYKLRTKEHLIINENERIKYQLKDERGTKRGRIIRISDKEIQVYNQVTGKLEVVKIDNLKTISRRQGWKAWAGYFSLYVGVTALIYGIFLGIFAIIFLIDSSNINFFGGREAGILYALGSILSALAGIGLTYSASNILYKYKKFRIDKKYKIGTYSMEKLDK